MPELKRCGLVPKQEAISIAHQHNTLIITVRCPFKFSTCLQYELYSHYCSTVLFQYQKPELVNQLERETLLMLQDVKTETDDDVDVLKQLYGLAK